MNNDSGMISCPLGCWLIAALGGVAAAALLMVLGDWSFIQAAFIGIILFVVGGLLLSWLMCRPLPAPNSVDRPSAAAGQRSSPASAPAPASGSEPAHVPAGETEGPAADAPGAPKSSSETGVEPAHVPAGETEGPASEPDTGAPGPAAVQGDPRVAGPLIKPSTPLPGQDELASRKGTWRYEGAAPAAVTPATASAAPAASGSDAAESAPATLQGPRASGADDLKLLKGVGPKLETTLNELGFYHFDQIAAWTDAEVAWVDNRLSFKGRIKRDGWIEQAKILAAGGETEFSRRNK